MREELEKLAAAGKISRAQIDPLLQVGTHGYVSHRSWGVGKISTWDWLFSKVIIDFQNRAGHSMDLAFAADLHPALTTVRIDGSTVKAGYSEVITAARLSSPPRARRLQLVARAPPRHCRSVRRARHHRQGLVEEPGHLGRVGLLCQADLEVLRLARGSGRRGAGVRDPGVRVEP